MKEYECPHCGYVYQPEKGDWNHRIPANTAFIDILDSWTCPLCNAPKNLFREHLKRGCNFEDFYPQRLKKTG